MKLNWMRWIFAGVVFSGAARAALVNVMKPRAPVDNAPVEKQVLVKRVVVEVVNHDDGLPSYALPLPEKSYLAKYHQIMPGVWALKPQATELGISGNDEERHLKFDNPAPVEFK